MSGARVAAVKCVSYDPEEVSTALDRAFSLLGGIESLIPADGRCLLKPNLLSPSEVSQAITTHPALVEATGRAIRKLGIDVVAGDSPGRGDTLKVAEVCGIAEACRRADVRLVPFDDEITVRHPTGAICKEFTLAREAALARSIVNIAKMKTHGFMAFTGAVKNMFGCIPGTKKARMHLRYQEPADFCVMLLDIVTLLKPALSILDAVIAMDGDGPSHGRVRRFGAILVSTDPVAVDTVSLVLAKVDPMRVPYLKAARELGIGQTRLDEIEVLGDPVEELAVDDFEMPKGGTPSPLFKWGAKFRRVATATPVIDRPKCTGCGQCVTSCPPQVIAIAGKKAAIDYNGCIRCYCCQEMCPAGAVTLSRGGLARLADRVFDSFNRR